MKLIIGIVLIFMGINAFAQENNPLPAILAAQDTVISQVMDHLAEHELQVVYTQIDRDSSGKAHFTEYDFQVDPTQYFYPASTVKLPVAILAMEKFLGRAITDTQNFDLDTPYKINGDSVVSTFRNDITAIFAVSDNMAYNRLFEFLGRDTIQDLMQRKGLVPVQIVHRLDVENSALAKTRAITVYVNQKDSIVWEGHSAPAITPLKINALTKGKAVMTNGNLINKPMDFSEKNYFPLGTQQEVLKRLFFPQHYDAKEVFALSEKNRDFLIETMQKSPRESGYDPQKYADSYAKFFMYGDIKDDIPNNIKIYNKVGDAYGTLTDNAYIKDEYNGVEFFLSATLLVNKNGIFNDDTYEYERLGIPFLAELGRRIYQFERLRQQTK